MSVPNKYNKQKKKQNKRLFGIWKKQYSSFKLRAQKSAHFGRFGVHYLQPFKNVTQVG